MADKRGEHRNAWHVVDGSQIQMRNGDGVVALPQPNGLIWIATKMAAGSLEYIGNGYSPEAARDFARELLAHADEIERRESRT